MDNTGLYISYGDLLLEMAIANNTKVNKSTINLSAKVSDPLGDKFTFSVGAGDPSPQVGDVVHQAGKTACIISFPAVDQIQIDTVDEIVNGPADLLHSETLPKGYAEMLIQQSMDFIDEQTGQFFNKRSGTYQVEGRNTPVMHLGVPIIEITKMLINSTDTELKEADGDFVAFKARGGLKDDRKNPRIKLNMGNNRSSIYSSSLTTRAFLKGTLTEITGSFGYLEPDGRTPYLIQKAVKILVMYDVNNPVGETESVTSDTGSLKRLKVDLHEQEFFESKNGTDTESSSDSGNEEVDRIIARFRTPVRIGGSFILRRLDENDLI